MLSGIFNLGGGETSNSTKEKKSKKKEEEEVSKVKDVKNLLVVDNDKDTK